MCENHDGLSHRSISEQRRLHSPSVDEQETEMEPSLEQDEEDKDQEHDQETEQNKGDDGSITPSRKKEIMVVMISWHIYYKYAKVDFFHVRIREGQTNKIFCQYEASSGLGAVRWRGQQGSWCTVWSVGAEQASKANTSLAIRGVTLWWL